MSWSSVNSKSSTSGLSKETESLLNEAMNKRGLSIRAQREMKDSISAGGDPFEVFSTKTAHAKMSTSKATTNSIPKPRKSQMQASALSLPGRFSSIRLKEEIETRIGGPVSEHRDQFVPSAPVPLRDDKKAQLQGIMTHGNARKANEVQTLDEKRREEAASKRAEEERQLENPKEALINQIFHEINERRQHLEGLVSRGLAMASNQQVRKLKLEIATRMAELDKLGIDTRKSKGSRVIDPSRLQLL